MMQQAKRRKVFLALGLVLAMCLAVPKVSAGLTHKDIDYDALEKAWEEDDDPEELLQEGETKWERVKKEEEKGASMPGVNQAKMLFIKLQLQKGEDWSNETMAVLAGTWRDMLRNGGVDVNVYNVSVNTLLVALNNGKDVPSVLRFLSEREEVQTVELDGNKVYEAKNQGQGIKEL